MRIFSGFRVSKPFQEQFTSFQANQKALLKLRWTKAEHLHITLWFYGEIEPEMLPNIIAVNKLIAKKINPFDLHFVKVKLAPKNQNARMIWAKYEKNESFEKLLISHQNSLSAIGLVEKEFTISRPHITLARFPEGKYKPKDFALNKTDFPPTLTVNELILWESIKMENGKQYKVIHSERL